MPAPLLVVPDVALASTIAALAPIPAAPQAAPDTPPDGPPTAVEDDSATVSPPSDAVGAADAALASRIAAPALASDDAGRRSDARTDADVRSPASRADAVLADAPEVAFEGVAFGSLTQLLLGDDLLSRLDEAQRRLLEEAESRRALVAQSVAITGGLSIGYVVWLVRGGVLLSSMLSALPAWQMIDPMPVLAAGSRKRRAAGPTPAAANDAAERIFESHVVAPPTSSPPSIVRSGNPGARASGAPASAADALPAGSTQEP
jgi:hypothetical protein